MKATRLLSETLLRAQERFEETLDQLDVAEEKGKVCVNGKSVKNPQHIVHEMLDTVTLFGEQIVYEPWIYIPLPVGK